MPMTKHALSEMLAVALSGALEELKRCGVPEEAPARVDAEMALAVWRRQGVAAMKAAVARLP
jgi:hypothetical protein